MKELRVQIDDGLFEELKKLLGVTMLSAKKPDSFLMIVGLICYAIDEGQRTLILDPDMEKHLGGNHRGKGGRMTDEG